MSGFKRATKEQAKLRMALAGPSGAGKTYTALRLAQHLAGTRRVRLIDTERGSASKYADTFDFDVCELTSYHPERYMDAIKDAQADGQCAVLVIDSLSHAWAGKDGALELVDKAAKRSQSGNSFGAWREVTPLQHQLVDTMLGADCHVIVTLRSKQEYVQEKDERGRTTIRKVGLAPVQREGIEFEFDVFATMDDATMMVSKSRCPELNDLVQSKPGDETAAILLRWLTTGAPVAPKPQPAPVEPAPRPDPEPILPWLQGVMAGDEVAMAGQAREVAVKAMVAHMEANKDKRGWIGALLEELYQLSTGMFVQPGQRVSQLIDGRIIEALTELSAEDVETFRVWVLGHD